MTIAQRFVELGEQMGIDTSNCKTGNIAEILNTLTQNVGGEVSDSQNIQIAMMNFNYSRGEDSPIIDPSQFDPNRTLDPYGDDDKMITDPIDNTNTTEPTNDAEGSGW